MDPIPGWRKSPGEGNGNPLQYSCLEALTGQRSLTVHGVTKESDMTQQLNTHFNNYLYLNESKSKA